MANDRPAARGFDAAMRRLTIDSIWPPMLDPIRHRLKTLIDATLT